MKARILVIDDEESIRFTFKRFLSLAGHSVITARDCREALERIEEGGIDLVFADIVLPDGTGIDLLKKIKSEKFSCPVIMMTAYPSVETMTDTRRLGASDYLSKPARQQEVIRSAEAALQDFGRTGK